MPTLSTIGWVDQVIIQVRRRTGETLNVLAMLAPADIPGLAITPTVGADIDIAKYAVTHVASGFSLGKFTSLDAAKMFMVDLAPLADWTIDGPALRANPILAARVEALQKTAGAK